MEKILPDDVLTLVYRYLRPDEPTPSALALKKFMQEEQLSADDFVRYYKEQKQYHAYLEERYYEERKEQDTVQGW